MIGQCLRRESKGDKARAQQAKGNFVEGLRYVWSRPELRATLIMLFLIGTFGLNFQIFIATMAVGVFHTDAKGFGLLSSFMALGTISGALFAASRAAPRFDTLLIGAAVFGHHLAFDDRRPGLGIRLLVEGADLGRVALLPDLHLPADKLAFSIETLGNRGHARHLRDTKTVASVALLSRKLNGPTGPLGQGLGKPLISL
jgi:hypothetical protein